MSCLFSSIVQPSVPVWLDLIGLSQYDQALIDAGYDDIDFISDITSEELEDIGITRRGGRGIISGCGCTMSLIQSFLLVSMKF